MQVFGTFIGLGIGLAGLGLGWYLGVAFVRDLHETYGRFFRRVRRSPQFGVGNLFTLVTIVAAACAIFRSVVRADPVWPEGCIFAVIALVWAIGIVLALQFSVTDVRDSFSRRSLPTDFRSLEPEPPTTNHQPPATEP